MPVSAGSTISVPKDSLGGAEGKKVTVKWSQNFRERSQEYWVAKFTDKSSNESGVIFVQVDKLDQLKSTAKSDEYTFAIDGDWQYGQKKDGSNRFVVYHNKENKMYQHRFVENTLTQLGSAAAGIVSGLGFSISTNIADVAKSIIGDYLKNF